MSFTFKREENGVRKYEVTLKGIEDLTAGLPTLRHLLEAATRDHKTIEVTFRHG